MAQLLVRGTQLQDSPAKAPLNKRFIFALGVIYLFAIHLPWPVFSLVERPTNSAMPTNLITWMSISLLISLGLVQVIRHRYLRYSKLTIGFFGCSILMTLPLLYSNPQIDESSPRLIGFWAGFLLFVLLQQFHFSNQHKQRIIWFIVLAGWIEAIRGYLLFDILQLNLPQLAQVSVWLSNNQIVTTFSDSNSIAAFLATAVVASGYLLSRIIKQYSQFSIVALLYLTPALMLPLIFMHSPIIATSTTIIGCMMILPYLYKFASLKRLKGWTVSLFIGVTISLGMFYQSSEEVISIERQHVNSYITSIKQASNMLIEKPFTGYGYGRFDEEYVLYSARQHQLNPTFPPALTDHIHPQNEPIYWAVEGGVLTLLSMILAAIMGTGRIISAKNGTRLASFALLLPISIQAQFSSLFYVSSIHWITLMILFFWVDQRVARYKSIPIVKWQNKIITLVTVLIPMITIFTIVGILHDQQRLTQYRQTLDNLTLNQLILPSLWQDELKEFSLVYALEHSKKSTHTETDVQWLLNKIKLHPRPYYYQLLIDMYHQLGDENRAKRTQTEARYLFPTESFISKYSDTARLN
ncbi:Wzy polymerase domain-containing protein [Vibrio sp. RC27]